MSPATRDEALREIRAFFEACQAGDPDFRFAFTSKVMLAVPGWSTLQRRFVERAEARLAGKPLPGFSFESKHEVALRLRAWGRFTRSFVRAVAYPAPVRRTEVLVFTLAGKGAAGARDAYFGSLVEWLHGEATTVYLVAGAETSLPGSAARIPLESYASASDVVAAWSESRRARLARLPTDPDHATLATRLARQEVASAEAFMHALMRRAFAKMLAALRPRVLVYPFENRAWEKSLVAAARAAGVGRVIGYQHSSITPRHLAFETGAVPPQPLPDAVITVGSVTAQWLRERAPALAGRIVEGASLRRGTAGIPLPSAHGLLVAISSSRDEALALMTLVHTAAPALRVPVVIRSHPTIPAADLYARFDWPAHVRLSDGGALEQDLAAATMVAYSSSTVALEGMLQGRLPLFADIGDLPAADPLIGDCAAKSSAADGTELAELVNAVCNTGAAELEAKRREAKRYAEAYLREPDAERVSVVVNAILAAKAGA